MIAQLNPPAINRCKWVNGSNELAVSYHDNEWGSPQRDSSRLFEMLTLEGAQAGLSWDTILRKREGYRSAFMSFDPEAVAKFGSADVERLLLDAGIVRHRGKIESTLNNARRVLEVQDEFGSFSKYIWSFVDNHPINNCWTANDRIPAESELSRKMSKELQGRGFRFVGPTTCYAFMQAAGLVNDHTVECYRHEGNRLD